MPIYTAPVNDTRFVLSEVLGLSRYSNLPGFANATPDLVEAILEEGGKFGDEVLAAAEQGRRRAGCTRNDDGSVTTPPGFKEAFDQFSTPAGRRCPRPRNMAGRGCPRSSPPRSANICCPPITASKCITA